MRDVNRHIIVAGALLGAIAVALGAFGAHGLKPRLDAQALDWWTTAVAYQMWHGLAVLGLGLSSWRKAGLPALTMTAGALVFAGTLYAMALGAPRWLGAVTPIGGVLMILAWLLVAVRAALDRD